MGSEIKGIDFLWQSSTRTYLPPIVLVEIHLNWLKKIKNKELNTALLCSRNIRQASGSRVFRIVQFVKNVFCFHFYLLRVPWKHIYLLKKQSNVKICSNSCTYYIFEVQVKWIRNVIKDEGFDLDLIKNIYN